ncbi:tyrosine-type recombinase/integrase [Granulicella arctica]|uniref:tyrosine-type recombinase/integrase n=1 Tax=Granulicella arctica TaxID=940613 RepID=UPI0021E0E0D6|nr:site-specific integrase [Granulicella arctica]
MLYYVEGQRHREKIGRRSDAITLYQKRKSDARADIKLPETFRLKKVVLFSDLATDAMVYSKAHKKSHRGDLSNLASLLPVFGMIRAQEITHQSIGDYLNSRTDLKPATLNRYRSTMSMIFAEGIRNGHVSVNPARLVRLRKEDNARIRFLSYEEEDLIRKIIVQRCLVHVPDFTIALETGVRLSEQHSIEWTDVFLDRRQIQLDKTKNGSSRTIILTEEAVAALELCSLRRSSKTPRVFLTRHGEAMASPRSWFDLVMKEAIAQDRGLSDVTWHIFRHTYISRLIMSGVDIRTVQELAGHKSISMTMRYAHLSPDHKLKAVDQLSAHRKAQGGNTKN